MLTNKITGFSADLLNTVRGILGEAKKCPADCECEKCEAEEMKEGSMPTADEPTDANKKTADKVRAMLAKEKKPMKEEILEMVEEASSGLADKAKKSGVSLSTLKKVYARGIAAWNSGHRPGTTPQQWAHARVNSYITKGKGTYHGADKDLRSEGTDMPFEGPYKKVGERKDEYGNKVKNVAKHLAKKAMNKQKNEEVEQVDEISSDMAHRYLKGKHERDYDTSADGKSSKTKKPQSFSKMNKDMISTARALRTIEKAKKANEEAEHNNCGTPECCGQCDTATQIDETAKIVAHLQKRYGDNIRKSHVRSAANDFGVDASKLAKAVRTKLGKNMLDEEQLDELSKATMGRYINKAKDSIDTASYRQGHKEAHGSSSKPLEKKLTKRHKGISTAVNKLTKEDAEQIDELSKDAMLKYLSANKKDDTKARETGDYDKMTKRMRGTDMAVRKYTAKPGSKYVRVPATEEVELAVNKLTKEEQDFVDSLNNEIFEKTDPYDIAGMIKKAKAKNDPNHPAMKHVAAIEDIKKHGGALSVQGDHVRSLIKALGEEVYIEEGEEKGGGYDGMPKGLQDRAPKGRARNAMGRAIARKERNLTRARMDRAAEMKKEEVEQIDEISKGTAMKALQHVSSDPDDVRGYTLQKKIGKKWPEMKGHAADASYTAGYGRSGRNIFQDRDKLADRAKTSYRMTKDGKANKQDLKARFRKEEIELDEARGRPRKAGAKDFTIHPKTKEKLMHNNPADMKRIERLQKNGVLEKPKVEAGQHIMNQLQKAKTSMLGGSKINFTHGDSKEVSGPHAAKILTKYAGMKPNEKEDFQKFVGHSHENLMKHV